jgi:hypothetical protein
VGAVHAVADGQCAPARTDVIGVCVIVRAHVHVGLRFSFGVALGLALGVLSNVSHTYIILPPSVARTHTDQLAVAVSLPLAAAFPLAHPLPRHNPCDAAPVPPRRPLSHPLRLRARTGSGPNKARTRYVHVGPDVQGAGGDTPAPACAEGAGADAGASQHFCARAV